MSRAGLFIDRDGVLIRDVDLMVRVDQIELMPGVTRAIVDARAAGFAVVVVSNQSVVARGLCDEDAVRAVHRAIDRQLLARGTSPLDGYWFCPHHPRADDPRYRQVCHCRKPRPGLLQQAAAALDIDLAASFLVGDRLTDVLAGFRAGCRTVLVETGMHRAPLLAGVDESELVAPDHIATDLQAAVEWIVHFHAEVGNDMLPG
jgi:D-glycero-D-manno-heptose 1,7-bisphosphate phosphatase